MIQARPAAALRLFGQTLGLTGAFGLCVGIQVMMVPILARIISPEAVGQVAITTPMITFATIVAEAGLIAGLVRNEVNGRMEATAFWCTAAVGAASATLIAAAAWPVGWAVRQPGLSLLLLCQAPALLMSILTIAPGARLQRDGAFGMIAISELLATVAAAAVTLTTALMGGGAFSLVAQQVVLAGIRLVGYVVLGRFRPAWVFDFPLMRPLLSLSLPLLGSNVMAFLARSLDNLLIGLGIGARPLGFYATAYNTGKITELALGAAVRIVTMPAVAQASDARAAQDAYANGLRTIGLIGAPIVVLASLKAAPLVLLVLGAKWMPAAPLVSILAPLGLVQSCFQLNVATLAGLGRARAQLKLSLLTSVLGLTGILVGFHWGAKGVAIGYAFGLVLASGPNFAIALRALDAPWALMMSSLARPLMASGIMLAAVFLRERLAPVHGDVADLALTVTVGAAAYGAALLGIGPTRPGGGRQPPAQPPG